MKIRCMFLAPTVKHLLREFFRTLRAAASAVGVQAMVVHG